jgi:hypothetical protein
MQLGPTRFSRNKGALPAKNMNELSAINELSETQLSEIDEGLVAERRF